MQKPQFLKVKNSLITEKHIIGFALGEGTGAAQYSDVATWTRRGCQQDIYAAPLRSQGG